MPDLRQHRPDSVAARRTRPEIPSHWLDRATTWLKATTETLTRIVTDETITDRFAELAARAREPEEVRVELVRLASVLTGASRVELFDDHDGRSNRRIASWPPIFPSEMTAETRSEPRGPISGTVARSLLDRSGPFALQIPLKAGEVAYGTLRLTASSRRTWPSRVVRRLEILCAIAAAAERGLGRPASQHSDGSSSDHPQGPHEASILAAFLTFAQAQARRRHESLSLMEVVVDRLDSIRELLGNELAEAAIERVMRAIKSTIRASDVVARLDAGRIAVLLPNANVENAMRVAEAIRTAIARTGAASTTMPALSATIALATYPDHAHDVATLRAAVSSTLTRARDQGNDQIALAPPIPAITLPTLNHRVG